MLELWHIRDGFFLPLQQFPFAFNSPAVAACFAVFADCAVTRNYHRDFVLSDSRKKQRMDCLTLSAIRKRRSRELRCGSIRWIRQQRHRDGQRTPLQLSLQRAIRHSFASVFNKSTPHYLGGDAVILEITQHLAGCECFKRETLPMLLPPAFNIKQGLRLGRRRIPVRS